MGLDTTHDCWHGAYGGFNEFREFVGRAAGLPYVHSGGRNVLDIDWDLVTPDQIAGKWRRMLPTVKPSGIYDPPITDPVLYLLIHSDCDGKLRRGYLPALRDRLIELEPAYNKFTADRPYLQSRLRVFIDGLTAAIDANEHVVFG